MREPLLHFIVLGAALFAVDHLIASRGDDPHTITVDANVDPTWLDNEVLYREGIAMQLDKGDPAIRDRVIFKVLGMIEAGLSTPTFNEKTLRDWFARNHAKYDQPGVPADFDKLGGVVLQDWIDATLAEQRSAAVLAMKKRYTVKVTGASAGTATKASE